MKRIFIEDLGSPWMGWTLAMDGALWSSGLPLGPRGSRVAHLFEPAYTGGHPDPHFRGPLNPKVGPHTAQKVGLPIK